MRYASSVIIVPGYGLAIAQGQQKLYEFVKLLQAAGVEVKFAVHPVAGRMPGQMDVLLAEAGVPYDLIFQLEDINDDFANTDVALVIGANDVVNPAARTDKSSPIFGMPILNADKAKKVYVVKRGDGKGYAGIAERAVLRRQLQHGLRRRPGRAGENDRSGARAGIVCRRLNRGEGDFAVWNRSTHYIWRRIDTLTAVSRRLRTLGTAC